MKKLKFRYGDVRDSRERGMVAHRLLDMILKLEETWRVFGS